MISVPVYSLEGKQVGTRDLPEALFGLKPNASLLHRAVTVAANNKRYAIAHTKRRGEVTGGGRKPWAQKGTGRARQGSIRSPQWKGGGAVFGPRSDRTFGGKVNRKERRLALLMALSDRVHEGKFFLVESFELSAPKTALLAKGLAKLPLSGKTLLVSRDRDEMLLRASRNNPAVSTAHLSLLSPTVVLFHTSCVLSTDALDAFMTARETSKKTTVGTKPAVKKTPVKVASPKKPRTERRPKKQIVSGA